MLFVSIEWSLEPKKHRFRNSCPCNEASMLPSPAPAAGKPAPQRTQPTQAAANVTPKWKHQRNQQSWHNGNFDGLCLVKLYFGHIMAKSTLEIGFMTIPVSLKQPDLLQPTRGYLGDSQSFQQAADLMVHVCRKPILVQAFQKQKVFGVPRSIVGR